MFDTGIILAAGFGKRLGAITQDIPKPLVMVHGRPLIDYAISNFLALGVKRIFINTHYKAEMIAEYIAASDYKNVQIELVYEPEILETGGGVLNILKQFNISAPVIISNSDIIMPMTDGIRKFIESWDERKMQVLGLLSDDTAGHERGDFDLDAKNRLIYNKAGKYIWAGFYILNPNIFQSRIVSNFRIMDVILKLPQGSIYGYHYPSEWQDLGDINRLSNRLLLNTYKQ